MKKIISMVLVCVLLACSMLTLASCGNISESYADKINKAADKKEHYTYDQVIEDLGEDAIDITVLKSGVIIAIKGVSSLDELEDKIDEGKTLKGIVVTVLAGKATKAAYKEITEDDLK